MKPRILWGSDSTFLPTGFANQTDLILRSLASTQKYEILQWSHQYQGNELIQVIPYGKPIEPWAHLPMTHGYYGQGNLEQQIKRLNPGLMGWLCDSFMLTQQQPHAGPRNDWVIKMINNLRRDGCKTKFLHYYPLDSDDIYQGFKEELEVMDVRVAMSRFAQRKVQKECGLESYYIPHCCDTYQFFPMNEEEKLKIRKGAGLENKFVVGSVGRNQSRKSPFRMFQVMEEFCKDKNDVVLLCHFDPQDPQAGVNTKEIASNCGFKEVNFLTHKDKRGNEIRFTGVHWQNGFPTQTLNQIYNSMDVHVMPTTGEGFGITIIEAMACGIPNAVTDYTSTHELLIEDGECGIPVPYNNYIHGGLNTKRVMCDWKAFAEILNRYYNSEELRKKHSRMAREKAVAFYSQQVVLPQWNSLIAETLDQDENYIKTLIQ